MAISATNKKLEDAEIAICEKIIIETTGTGEEATSTIKQSDKYGGLALTMQQKGEQLIKDLTTTFSTFSGNTREVVMDKIGTVEAQGTPEEGKLAYLLCQTLPAMIKQIAVIIEVNRNLIEQYDTGLAKALQESGQQTGQQN